MRDSKKVYREHVKGLIIIIIGVVAFITISELADNETADPFSVLSIGVIGFGAGKVFTALNLRV